MLKFRAGVNQERLLPCPDLTYPAGRSNKATSLSPSLTINPIRHRRKREREKETEKERERKRKKEKERERKRKKEKERE